VDEAQARIWEEKVSPPVQGDFGIAQLANVLSQFQNDASFTSRFYQCAFTSRFYQCVLGVRLAWCHIQAMLALLPHRAAASRFVHLEERTLDEAEMAPEDLNAKCVCTSAAAAGPAGLPMQRLFCSTCISWVQAKGF
jgi:hypothetical protein